MQFEDIFIYYPFFWIDIDTIEHIYPEESFHIKIMSYLNCA